MMRKVVQHGPSTMVVSLPIKWVRKNNVEKGDELRVTDENNRIVVSVDKETKERKAEIDVTDLSRSAIMFYLRSIYRQGYDEIKVTFKDQKTIHYAKDEEISVPLVIHQEVNRLTSIEITQQRDDFIIIKDLSGTGDASLNNIVNRIFFLLKDTLSDMAESIKNKDKTTLETVEEKHNSITKFVSYCMRVINKKTNLSIETTPGLYHVLGSIDLKIDIIKYFVRFVLMTDMKVSDSTLKLIDKIVETNNLVQDAFMDFDLNKVGQFMKVRAEAKDLMDNIMKQKFDREASLIFYLGTLLEIDRDIIEAKMSITPPKDS